MAKKQENIEKTPVNKPKKPKKMKKRTLESKQKKYGYLFTLPFIIGALIFVVLPTLHSVILSFARVENAGIYHCFGCEFHGVAAREDAPDIYFDDEEDAENGDYDNGLNEDADFGDDFNDDFDDDVYNDFDAQETGYNPQGITPLSAVEAVPTDFEEIEPADFEDFEPYDDDNYEGLEVHDCEDGNRPTLLRVIFGNAHCQSCPGDCRPVICEVCEGVCEIEEPCAVCEGDEYLVTACENCEGRGTITSACNVCNGACQGTGVNVLGFNLSRFGGGNYNEIWLVQPQFRQIVINAVSSMAYNVPIAVIFAFFMASVLNTKFKGRGFARSVMFLPVIISTGMIVSLSADTLVSNIMDSADRFGATGGGVEVTTAFRVMLTNMEVADWMINLLVNSVAGIATIVAMAAVSIVIFLAGLQSISPSIYEASYIEGATKWEVFWKISLPMISPLILLSVIYTIVDNFNSSNNPVIWTIHQNIVGMRLDIASAMAVSYSLLVLVVLVIVFAIMNKVVFYQD